MATNLHIWHRAAKGVAGMAGMEDRSADGRTSATREGFAGLRRTFRYPNDLGAAMPRSAQNPGARRGTLRKELSLPRNAMNDYAQNSGHFTRVRIASNPNSTTLLWTN